jgi:hypothetical protein
MSNIVSAFNYAAVDLWSDVPAVYDSHGGPPTTQTKERRRVKTTNLTNHTNGKKNEEGKTTKAPKEHKGFCSGASRICRYFGSMRLINH